MLTLDPARERFLARCPACGQDYLCLTGFVLRDGAAHAVYHAGLHGHGDEHEAWLDVTLAEVVDPADPRPRVSFGCRVGSFGSHGGLGATLTDGAFDHSDAVAATLGRRLTAEEALADRRLEELWAVVDLLLVADPDLRGRTES